MSEGSFTPMDGEICFSAPLPMSAPAPASAQPCGRTPPRADYTQLLGRQTVARDVTAASMLNMQNAEYKMEMPEQSIRQQVPELTEAQKALEQLLGMPYSEICALRARRRAEFLASPVSDGDE